MADIYFDVDTALAEVAVNAVPIVDAATGATIKTDLAYNASGLALFWHFVTPAGAHTVTAVTPTTGGSYDWAAQSTSGIYTIEMPASGGASINNDTEGFGWFTGFATGYLPWRSPIYGFRAAGLNDALIEGAYSTTRGLAGTALPNAAAEAAGGLFTRGTGAGQINQAANGQIDANTTHAAGTAWGSGAITAASIASDAITAAKVADDVSTEIRTKVMALTTGSGTVGSGSTTANVVASAVAVGATTSLSADAWKGRVIIFNSDTTTAALRGQAAAIVSHTSGSTPTFTLATGAWTTAPLSGDTFTVV